jgi:two-component system alkaline phosphatase synthesis response regulator PhoP
MVSVETKIRIDGDSYTVVINEEVFQLSRKEFQLIYLLSSKPGKVFTREEIFENVWKRKLNHEERTIDVHILRLRKKLGENIIYTLKGVGYKILIKEQNLIRN